MDRALLPHELGVRLSSQLLVRVGQCSLRHSVESDKHSWMHDFFHQRLIVQRRNRLSAGLQLDAGLDAHQLFGDRNRVGRATWSSPTVRLRRSSGTFLRLAATDPAGRFNTACLQRSTHIRTSLEVRTESMERSRWGSSRSSFSLSDSPVESPPHRLKAYVERSACVAAYGHDLSNPL